jgi:hypothetical protein
MVDSTLKKIILPNNQLPPITFSTNTVSLGGGQEREEIDELFYALRYRVVSEDRNRRSHWSPITKISMPDISDPLPYTATDRFFISKSGGNPETVTAIWSFPRDVDEPTEYEKIFRNIIVYDIWIRWSEENNADENTTDWSDWEYVSTVSSNTFSIVKPDDNFRTVEIAVQATTLNKVRDYNNNKLTLFRNFGAV